MCKAISSKKIVISVFFLFAQTIVLYGQEPSFCSPNLVPNYNFEQNDAVLCNSDLSGISQIWIDTSIVTGWYGTSFKNGSGSGITPDYYNSNCNQANSSIDCMDGDGSLGVYTSTNAGTNSSNNVREYIQCQLNGPLNAGSTYYIEMKVRSGSGNFWAKTDGFGAWFRQSNTPFNIANQNGNSFISATPQFQNQAGNIIGDSCQIISGYFCAAGNENWLVIGNFKTDGQLVVENNTGGLSYVVVDNVIVKEVCAGFSPPPLFNIISTSNSISCGQSVTIEAFQNSSSFGALTYQWISPTSLNGITGLGPFTENLYQNTNYTLSYTVNGNCGSFTGQSNLSINVGSGVTINPITITNETCVGNCDGAISVSLSGGSPPYVVEWFDNNANLIGNSSSIDNLCTGNYIINVTTTEQINRIDTLLQENFESGTNNWVLNTNPTNGVNDINSNFWEITNQPIGPSIVSCVPSSDFTLNLGCVSCSSPNNYAAFETSKMAESPAINTNGYSNITVSFDYIGETIFSHALGKLYYYNGSNWVFASNLVSPTCWGPYNGWTSATFNLPIQANNIPNLKIGFNWYNDDYIIPKTWGLAVDNIKISGQTLMPVNCTKIDTFNIAGINCGDCNISVNTTVINESCNGADDGEIEFDLSGLGNYDLYINNILTYNDITAGIYTSQPLSAGNYNVKIINTSIQTCDTIFNVIVNPGTTINISSLTSTNNSSCNNPDGTITLSANGDVFELYSLPLNNLITTNDNGAFFGLAAGNYFVSITSGLCSINTSAVTINDINSFQPAINLTGQQYLCANDTIELYVITPNSNLCQWSNGIIGGLNQVINPGSYFVVCENLDGCSGTSGTVIVEMVNNPEAAFTYSQIDNYTVDFYNNSTNATSYLWQFPNGISLDASTTYDFVSDGIYQIKLIASNDCGSDSVLVDVVVDKLSTVNEYGNLQTKIFPNPANEKITIILNKHVINITIEVYDMYGKLLIAEVNKSGKQYDLNTSTFASGAYFIKLITADTQSRTMFIKN
jgi:hypothetical protein